MKSVCKSQRNIHSVHVESKPEMYHICWRYVWLSFYFNSYNGHQNLLI